MGLQGHRRTSSHKRRRASHFALKATSLSECSHCKKPVKTHHVCEACGYYKDRQVIKVKSKVLKKVTKAKKEAKAEKKEEKA